MIYNEPKGVATVIIKLFFDHNGIKVSNFLQRTEAGRRAILKSRRIGIIKTLKWGNLVHPMGQPKLLWFDL